MWLGGGGLGRRDHWSEKISRGSDLNRQPIAYEAIALPIELPRQNYIEYLNLCSVVKQLAHMAIGSLRERAQNCGRVVGMKPSTLKSPRSKGFAELQYPFELTAKR